MRRVKSFTFFQGSDLSSQERTHEEWYSVKGEVYIFDTD